MKVTTAASLVREYPIKPFLIERCGHRMDVSDLTQSGKRYAASRAAGPLRDAPALAVLTWAKLRQDSVACSRAQFDEPPYTGPHYGCAQG